MKWSAAIPFVINLAGGIKILPGIPVNRLHLKLSNKYPVEIEVRCL